MTVLLAATGSFGSLLPVSLAAHDGPTADAARAEPTKPEKADKPDPK